MVGDVCGVDWLGERLMLSMEMTDNGDRTADVLLLDCRPPAEYQAEHIAGAVHLAVPTLMLRRLATGSLPVSSVVGCLQDVDSVSDTSTAGCRHKTDETLVLYDQSSCSVADDVSVTSPSQMTSYHVVSVLLRRLKQDGFRVYLLDGGYAAFSHKYPRLCVTSLSRDHQDGAGGVGRGDMSTVLGLHRLRLHQSAVTTAPTAGDGRTETAPGAGDSGGKSVSPEAAVDVFATSFPVEVLPYLYLGNARSSADLDVLYRNGIGYILNVTPDVPNSFAASDQFRYMQIPINDHWSQNMAAYFPDAIAFIDEARRNECGVLVHCLAGISRSVTVTVAYLMHALDLSLSDAYDHVKHCKPDVSPNFSFMGQLMDFERSLRARRAAAESPPYLAVAPPPGVDLPDGPTATMMDGVDRTGHSSPVSSLSSLSTSSAAAALSSCSSASSSAFEYEIPASSRHVNC